MIVVGTAVVNASTGKVELIAPMGFGTARGVRLSNFTGDTLILTDISGTSQSQEYLAPQTQMVYPTANVGNTPFVLGYSYPPSQVAANLLVEWSTDPDADFIGTYPASLPTGITTSLAGTNLINSYPSGTQFGSTPILLGDIASDYVMVELIYDGASVTDSWSQLIHIYEGPQTDAIGTDVYVFVGNKGSLHGSTIVQIPLRLTHITPSLYMSVSGYSTGRATGAINLYSLNTSNVPFCYTDLLSPFYFSSNSPGAGVQSLALSPGVQAAHPVSGNLLQYVGRCDLVVSEVGSTGFTSAGTATLVGTQPYGNAATPDGVDLLLQCDSANAAQYSSTIGAVNDYYTYSGVISPLWTASFSAWYLFFKAATPAGYNAVWQARLRQHREPYAASSL